MQTASNSIAYWDEKESEFEEDELDETPEWIRNLKVHSQIKYCTLRFKCVSTGKEYILDPCGHEDVIFQVTSEYSVGWTHCKYLYHYTGGGRQTNHTDNRKARKKMDHLEALNVQLVREQVAAMRIQRHWRKARASPQYYLCRKRLREEFEKDENLKKNRKQ